MNNIHYTIYNNNNYILVKNNGSHLEILCFSKQFDIPKKNFLNYNNDLKNFFLNYNNDIKNYFLNYDNDIKNNFLKVIIL